MTTDEPVTTEDTAAVAETSAAAAPARSRLQKWLAPVLLVVLLAASAGVAGWLYFTDYRSDQQIDDTARQAVLTAAADGAVALLSYSPATLDADFANAKSRMTGDFLDYYTQFTDEIVAPAAKEKQVQTSAAVTRKAIVDIEPGTAEVLVFINQSTTSRDNPDGSFTASAVKVVLEKQDGAWLISAFDPV
ncbi:twin-arginine translocation pathway signal [Mycobacterium sp. AMU20-3851]|uniref:twin-arginine translocation pathway signal n=1 Tax=Mycobacterium sp. AMU20-3851 TaxID=3122055 RepID=UPI003754D257